MQYFYRDSKLGILGGGQLGRMLIQAAIDFNIYIRVMDSSADAPCKYLAHEFIQGDITDFEAVYRFGQGCDIITIEIENVNTEALEALQKEGKTVYPDPKIVRMIQNKRKQKQFYVDHGLPTSPFHLVENKEQVKALGSFLPAVNKLGEAGYDGRGVQVLKNKGDLEKAFDAPGVLEKFVDFEKEIAVIVARNAKGEIKSFPLVEMVFHPVHNLVEYLLCPAQLSDKYVKKANEIAHELVQKLDFVGLLAIEMFLTPSGEILINEIAPRPHNSGHHTIRSCATSQYEQHLRAIFNLPLGDTTSLHPAAMVNLLGASGYTGAVKYKGIAEVLNISGVYPHFYGKSTTKPQRKMGHVTILEKDPEKMKKKIQMVKEKLRVLSD